MKKISLFIVSFVASALFAVSVAPAIARAADDPFDPYHGACEQATTNNNGAAPAACTPADTNPVSGNDSLLAKATNIITIVAGVVAVVMLMFNGVKIMLSAGDSAQFEKAWKSLIYISVGIAIIVLARTIISFILNRI